MGTERLVPDSTASPAGSTPVDTSIRWYLIFQAFQPLFILVEDEMMLRMRQTLGKQLKGDVQLTYASTGFIYAFDVPIASVTSSAA